MNKSLGEVIEIFNSKLISYKYVQYFVNIINNEGKNMNETLGEIIEIYI